MLILSKHPKKYTNNKGCISIFCRVCSLCYITAVTVISFSIGAVTVAAVHHMMLSACMASLRLHHLDSCVFTSFALQVASSEQMTLMLTAAS